MSRLLTRPKGRSIALAAVPLAVLAVAVPTVAIAAGGGTTYTACVDTSGSEQGDIDQVKAGTSPVGGSCSSGETQISWNSEGAVGAQGAKGDAGVSGYTIVSRDVSIGARSAASWRIDCPTGTVALGGGARAGDRVYLSASHPADGGDAWRVRLSNTSPNTRQIEIFATCASA